MASLPKNFVSADELSEDQWRRIHEIERKANEFAALLDSTLIPESSSYPRIAVDKLREVVMAAEAAIRREEIASDIKRTRRSPYAGKS